MVILAGYFTTFNYSYGLFSSIGFLSFPFIMGNGEMPYPMYIRGVDFSSSPAYEMGYFIEIVVTITGNCMYFPFICMVMSFILFAICWIEILTQKLKDLTETEDQDRLHLKLRLYVEYHLRVIRYVDELNSLISPLCLVEIILYGLLLSALLFLILTLTQLTPLILTIGQISFILFQLFTFYWLCNELISQSTRLANAVYDIPWYAYTPRNQRTIQWLIIRAQQRPMMIMIGAFTSVNLERFQSVLNVSYTYITLLRGKLQ